jgi:hypothetical protein
MNDRGQGTVSSQAHRGTRQLLHSQRRWNDRGVTAEAEAERHGLFKVTVTLCSDL